MKWTLSTASIAMLCLAFGSVGAADEAEPRGTAREAARDGAQDGAGEPTRAPRGGVEEITVTGSLVPRTQTDGPSSIDVIDRVEIENLGAQSPIELIERLTYNSGSQARADAFRFGNGYGSAQVNLRGLGLGTSLVLVDGRRRALSGVVANDGSTFVDINAIPVPMIERVEVLKEGAAATYGTDAVAGVVNFITRKNIEGFEIRTDYQRARSGQVEQGINGAFGWTSADERTHFQIGGGYFDSNQLNSTERDFTAALRDGNGRIIRFPTAARQDNNYSLAGGPGAFFVPASLGPINQSPAAILAANGGDPTVALVPGGPTLGQAVTAIGTSQTIGSLPVIDPNCEQANGSATLNVAPGVGFCAIEFVDNFNINEHEQRVRYNVLFRQALSETTELTLKVDFFNNKIDDVGLSPSFPPVTPFFIPTGNPGNFLGAVLVQSRSGRPLGENSATARGFFSTRNMRYEAGLTGELSEGWNWDLNVGYNQEVRKANAPDTFQAEYQNSLLGLGGSGCPLLKTQGLSVFNAGAAAAAAGVTPGQGPCQYFNPFASAILNPDGTGVGGNRLGNSQDVINAFTGRLKTSRTTSLLYVDGLITGELMELPAGPVGIALGYQYRRDTYEIDRNADQTVDQNGVNAVTGLATSRFLFLGGGSEVDVEQTATAFFSELVIPATSALELQAAVRFEDYNGAIGSSVDPKIGFRLDAADWLTLRGSFSTTFRAPSLNQQRSRDTAQINLTSRGASGRDSGFKAVDASGSTDLKPEEADVYNFGAILNPFDGFNLTVDYFRIDFKDIIVSQVAQNLINAEEQLLANAGLIASNPANFCSQPGFIATTNSAGKQIVTRNPDCSVARVEASFINNPSLITDGIDVGLTWDMNVAGLDAFQFFSNVTHLIQFDIQQPQGTVKAAGSLNETVFASSLPKWRLTTGIQGALGNHAAGLTFRLISGYEDDRSGRNIGSHNEVDFFYRYDLQRYDATLQVGVINLLDNEPPFVDLNFNFDTRVVDARGRRFYSNLTWRF